jgi:hypothetical protein
MSEWKETIILSDPEIVSRMILMMMCIDDGIGTKDFKELQESIPSVSESRINQQPIDKK